jgi:toxin ParE1/3/4
VVRLSVRWTERALEQLREIGAYIALENQDAAKLLVEKVRDATDRLESFPESGRKVPEYMSLPHREIVIPPCRVFYRIQGKTVWIIHVTRSERIIRRSNLAH